MATDIKYNGAVIASPEAGQTATLKCAGLKMESDVVVEVAEQTGSAGGSAVRLQEKTVTSNGHIYPDEGYGGLSHVYVNLPVYKGHWRI